MMSQTVISSLSTAKVARLAMRGYRPSSTRLELMAAKKPPLSPELLEPLILRLRGRRVMLDSDLARLYGVSTKRFNETLQRNKARFPDDFAFQLTGAEVFSLRSQIATSKPQASEIKEETSLRSQTVTSNSSQSATSSRGGRRYVPWVFTEHGALMAANILRSDHAVQINYRRWLA